MKFLPAVFLLCTLAQGQDFVLPSPSSDRSLAEQRYELVLLAHQSRSVPKWQWIGLTALNAGVMAYDGHQTANVGLEVGTPWLYGSHPYRHKVQLGFVLGGEFAVTLAASAILRHRHSRFWFVPQAVTTVTHGCAIPINYSRGIKP